MSKLSKVIAIDGPAASGKSSVSRLLAKELGWRWLSSGVFYRGLAYLAVKEKCDPNDVETLVALARSDKYRVELSPEDTLFFYNGEDVTGEIKAEEVGNMASLISPHSEVRKILLKGQRDLADDRGLVAEGRDCGSVVYPDAVAKFYLTARSESRAQRRAQEQGVNMSEVLADQKQRDAQDSSRTVAPLQVADNAHVVDTSELNLEQVVAQVKSMALDALDRHRLGSL